ncbi:MAG: hypothetical protein II286_03805, partial [Clostridia bacterium]|nr:hypothetical protein [Clostridia bacterium]
MRFKRLISAALCIIMLILAAEYTPVIEIEASAKKTASQLKQELEDAKKESNKLKQQINELKKE